MPKISAGFILQSEQPLDSRDQVQLKTDLTQLTAQGVEEGHITYVVQERRHYTFKKNFEYVDDNGVSHTTPSTGAWVPFSGGGTINEGDIYNVTNNYYGIETLGSLDINIKIRNYPGNEESIPCPLYGPYQLSSYNPSNFLDGFRVGGSGSTGGNLYVWDGDDSSDLDPSQAVNGFIDCGAGTPGSVWGSTKEEYENIYLHIRYSDDGGVTFSSWNGRIPSKYIGRCWNNDAVGPTDPHDYIWTLMKGTDGFGYEYIYKLTQDYTAPEVPETNRNDVRVIGGVRKTWESFDYVPEGWTDNPGDVTEILKYCWVCTRTYNKGSWSDWHGKLLFDNEDNPVYNPDGVTQKEVALLYARWGEDGAPGRNALRDRTWMIFANAPEGVRPDTPTDPNNAVYWDIPNNELVNLDRLTTTINGGGQQVTSFHWMENNENPASGERTWVSMGTFTEVEEEEGDQPRRGKCVGGWSMPVCISGRDGENGVDKEGMEFVYKLFVDYNDFVTNCPISIYPRNPQDTHSPDNIPDGWTDRPSGITPTNKVEAASYRVYNDQTQTWGPYSRPFIWSMWGEEGVDGDGVEYIFCIANDDQVVPGDNGEIHLKTSNPLDPHSFWIPTNEESFTNKCTELGISSAATEIEHYKTTREWLPTELFSKKTVSTAAVTCWTDNPRDTSASKPYEFVSMRRYIGETERWGWWSEPALWSKFAFDGESRFTSYAFTRTNADISTAVPYGHEERRFLPTKTYVTAPTEENPAPAEFTYTESHIDPNTGLDNPTTSRVTWHDSVPSGTAQVWVTTRVFSSMNTESTFENEVWSPPTKLGDSTGFQVEYCAEENITENLWSIIKSYDLNKFRTDANAEGIDEVGWRTVIFQRTQEERGVGLVFGDDDTIQNPVWMITSVKENGVWSNWNVIKIKGEKGDVGTGIKILGYKESIEDLAHIVDPEPPHDPISEIGDCWIVQGGLWIFDGNTDTTNDIAYGEGYVLKIFDGHYWIFAPDVVERYGEENLEDHLDEGHMLDLGDRYHGFVYQGQFKGDPGDPGASSFIHYRFANVCSEEDFQTGIAEEGGAGLNYYKFSDDVYLVLTAGDLQGKKRGSAPGQYIGLWINNRSAEPDETRADQYFWSKWSGDDVYGFEQVFKLAPSKPNAPTFTRQYSYSKGDKTITISNEDEFNKFDVVPEGWKDLPQAPDKDNICWVSCRKLSDIDNPGWRDPVFYSRYASDGKDGKSVEYVYHLGDYNSAPTIDTTTATGNIPEGEPVPALAGKIVLAYQNVYVGDDLAISLLPHPYFYVGGENKSDSNKVTWQNPVVSGSVTSCTLSAWGNYSLVIGSKAAGSVTFKCTYNETEYTKVVNIVPVESETSYFPEALCKNGIDTDVCPAIIYNTVSGTWNNISDLSLVIKSGENYLSGWTVSSSDSLISSITPSGSLYKVSIDSSARPTTGKDITFTFSNGSGLTVTHTISLLVVGASEEGRVIKNDVSPETWKTTPDLCPGDGNGYFWTDNPSGIQDVDGMRVEYVSIRFSEWNYETEQMEWGDWSAPKPWATWGRKGQDGDGVEYIFTTSSGFNAIPDNPTPRTSLSPGSVDPHSSFIEIDTSYTNPETEKKWTDDDFVPIGWSDDPLELSENTDKYQWVSMRRQKKDPITKEQYWGAFSDPVIWSMFTKDGVDGEYKEYAYFRTAEYIREVIEPEGEGGEETIIENAPNVECIRAIKWSGNNPTYYTFSESEGKYTILTPEGSDVSWENTDDLLPCTDVEHSNSSDVYWTDNPKGVNREMKCEWVIYRTKERDPEDKNRLYWSSWSEPKPWSVFGDTGKDGDGVEYIFTLTADEEHVPELEVASVYEDGTSNLNWSYRTWTRRSPEYQYRFEDDEYLPDPEYNGQGNPTRQVWYDDPQQTTYTERCQWVSMRRQIDGIWDLTKPSCRWSPPVIWSKFALDGKNRQLFYHYGLPSGEKPQARISVESNAEFVEGTPNDKKDANTLVRPGDGNLGDTNLWSIEPLDLANESDQDGNNKRYIYVAERILDYRPEMIPDPTWEGDPAEAPAVEGENYIYSWSDFVVTLNSAWGEKGDDGDGVEYVYWAVSEAQHTYIQSNSPIIPNEDSYPEVVENPETGDFETITHKAEQDEFLPRVDLDGSNNLVPAEDEIADTDFNSATKPYLYVSQRKKLDGSWQSFSQLTLWSQLVVATEMSQTLNLQEDTESIEVAISNRDASDNPIEWTSVDENVSGSENTLTLSYGKSVKNIQRIDVEFPSGVSGTIYFEGRPADSLPAIAEATIGGFTFTAAEVDSGHPEVAVNWTSTSNLVFGAREDANTKPKDISFYFTAYGQYEPEAEGTETEKYLYHASAIYHIHPVVGTIIEIIPQTSILSKEWAPGAQNSSNPGVFKQESLVFYLHHKKSGEVRVLDNKTYATLKGDGNFKFDVIVDSEELNDALEVPPLITFPSADPAHENDQAIIVLDLTDNNLKDRVANIGLRVTNSEDEITDEELVQIVFDGAPGQQGPAGETHYMVRQYCAFYDRGFTQAADAGWTTNLAEAQEYWGPSEEGEEDGPGRYLYAREVLDSDLADKSDPNSSDNGEVWGSADIFLWGVWGMDGTSGRSILSVTEYYKASQSQSSIEWPGDDVAVDGVWSIPANPAPADYLMYGTYPNHSVRPASDPGTDGGWTTDPNGTEYGAGGYKYLWNLEVIHYDKALDGNWYDVTAPSLIANWSNDGEPGAPGRGIVSIDEYYRKTSGSTVLTSSDFNIDNPTQGGWVKVPDGTMPQTDETNPLLWNVEVITYTSGDPIKTCTVPARIGNFANDGKDSVYVMLDNQTDEIFYTGDLPLYDSSVSTTATLYKGGIKIIPTRWRNTKDGISDLNLNAEEKSGGTYEITVSGIEGASASVTAIAEYGGKTYSAVFTIKKNSGSIRYRLMPSSKQIVYNKTTETYSPSRDIIVNIKKETLNPGTGEVSVQSATISDLINSDLYIVYKNPGVSSAYGTCINSSSNNTSFTITAGGYETPGYVCLYKSSSNPGNQLSLSSDSEGVVEWEDISYNHVKNGATVYKLDLSNDNDTMLYDSYDSSGQLLSGPITLTANLYYGGKLIAEREDGVWPNSSNWALYLYYEGTTGVADLSRKSNYSSYDEYYYATSSSVSINPTSTSTGAKTVTVSGINADSAQLKFVAYAVATGDIVSSATLSIKKLVGTEKYDLEINPAPVHGDQSGTAKEVSVEVYKYSVIGDGERTKVEDNTGLSLISSPNRTFTWNGTSKKWVGTITTDTTITLKRDAEVLDSETIPYLYDGENGIDGDPGRYSESVYFLLTRDEYENGSYSIMDNSYTINSSSPSATPPTANVTVGSSTISQVEARGGSIPAAASRAKANDEFLPVISISSSGKYVFATDNPSSISTNYPIQLIAIRHKTGSSTLSWDEFNEPVLFSERGENGLSGYGYQAAFSVTSEFINSASASGTASQSFLKWNDYTSYGNPPFIWEIDGHATTTTFTASVPAVTSANPYLWMTTRQRVEGGVWGDWTEPTLMSVDSYLGTVFGEKNVSSEKGALLRNFIGVFDTVTSGSNNRDRLRAFMNASSSIGSDDKYITGQGTDSVTGKTYSAHSGVQKVFAAGLNNGKTYSDGETSLVDTSAGTFRVYSDGHVISSGLEAKTAEIVDSSIARIRTGLIYSDASSNNDLQIDGRIGEVKARKVRTPFIDYNSDDTWDDFTWTDWEGNTGTVGGGWSKYDCVRLTQPSSTALELPTDVKQSGRRLVIIAAWSDTNSAGRQVYAGTNKLIENGRPRSSIKLKGGQVLELLGVGTDTSFSYWVVLKIYGYNTTYTVGQRDVGILGHLKLEVKGSSSGITCSATDLGSMYSNDLIATRLKINSSSVSSGRVTNASSAGLASGGGVGWTVYFNDLILPSKDNFLVQLTPMNQYVVDGNSRYFFMTNLISTDIDSSGHPSFTFSVLNFYTSSTAGNKPTYFPNSSGTSESNTDLTIYATMYNPRALRYYYGD